MNDRSVREAASLIIGSANVLLQALDDLGLSSHRDISAGWDELSEAVAALSTALEAADG